jgi:hypothetical protein
MALMPVKLARSDLPYGHLNGDGHSEFKARQMLALQEPKVALHSA